MTLFIIIVVMWFVWLAWVWPKKPSWKRTTAGAWPAHRGKTGLKHKLASRS
jgi:hypothetical protein